MQMRAATRRLSVSSLASAFGFNVTRLKTHNKVNPIRVEQLSSVSVNTF